MYFGIDEPRVAALTRTLVRPNSVIYDIGAHIGYTTVIFAHYLKNTGQVHAFEILPSTSGLLRRTVEANGFKNVVIHNVGLGDREMTLNLPRGNTSMTKVDAELRTGEALEVCRVVPLDTYVQQNMLSAPSLIKVDIEGAEIDFLAGADQLISRYRPTMIIEFHSSRLFKKGFEILNARGYKLARSSGPVVEANLAEVKPFPTNILCIPPMAP